MPESLLERRRTRRKLTASALTEVGASLADVDLRLLHWLLRYPLQRADDLIVGVARWSSRATVYRHLHALEARVLVESVLPKTPGTGKRLYYLSNPGLHLLARHLEKPARQLARKWHADEVGLLHFLPRLPTLLVLQDVVNGLVDYTAEAMTTQGRRPRLVRWNWQRDVTHRFLYREQRMRFFADGLIALCIRTQQENSMLDQWYGLFLLATELDDERLMRLRLERLLYWRESPERWSTYQHMLPVLILARSQRQGDHWQRAVEASTLKLRLDPLVGALVCLPPQESVSVNPWLLNWRTLAIDVPCHLQELFKPVLRSAFLSSLCLEESQEEVYDNHSLSSATARAVSSGTSPRLNRLIVGSLAKRAAHVTKAGLEEREVISFLGLLLTPCQWGIVRLLLEHPLLSDEDLAAFLGLQRRSVRCALYDLHQLGCLEPIVTEIGKRWHVCERGLRLIAAANHIHIRSIASVSDNETNLETSTITQQGEAWFLQHTQHTAGIYGFFATVTNAAGKETGHDLCWWETGAMCERRYRVGEQWYNFRPDALAEYRIGSQHVRFWLEWDRGTMNVRDLSIKFTAYEHFVTSREWVREDARVPRLFCVVPDIAQEKRVRRVAHARLTHTSGLVVCTTTEVLLNEHGPLAPIWLLGTQGCDQGGLTGSVQRYGWSQLISQSKAM
jgi:Replication-relaxation